MPTNLLKPPSESDEQKTLILKKLRRLSFEIVSDELKYPADNKQCQSDSPQAETKKQNGNIRSDSAIIGMPKVCIRRLIGMLVTAAEYSSIHSSQLLRPSFSALRFCDDSITLTPAGQRSRRQTVADLLFVGQFEIIEKLHRHK